MVREVVCDSCTLILLARVGLLEKLFFYADKMIIPDKVFEEVVVAGKKRGKIDAFIVEKEIGTKIEVVSVKQNALVKGLMNDFRIDSGEAEAIVLCMEKNALFLCTDDREAMKVCRVYSIPFLTAVVVCVKLFKDKKIFREEANIVLSKLEETGFYSKELLAEARKECD